MSVYNRTIEQMAALLELVVEAEKRNVPGLTVKEVVADISKELGLVWGEE